MDVGAKPLRTELYLSKLLFCTYKTAGGKTHVNVGALRRVWQQPVPVRMQVVACVRRSQCREVTKMT